MIPVPADKLKDPKPTRQHSRKPLPDHLDRHDEVLSPCDNCGRCGGHLKTLGEDVTEELEYVPGRFVVNRIIRPRKAFTCCEAIVQSPLPYRPIERGRPGPGLLAHVLVSKYADHLPLYWQSLIYAREGVDIDRSTMSDWVGRATALLEPLAELIGRMIAVEYLRCAVYCQRVFQGFNTEVRIHAVGQPPSQNFAAVPIHDRHKIQEPASYWDVGNIGAPHLVWVINQHIPQQIWPDLMLRIFLTGIWFLIDGQQSHETHKTADPMAATLVVVALHVTRHLARSVPRRFQEPHPRVSDLLCMSSLSHASLTKEHDNNDDIQRSFRRAA